MFDNYKIRWLLITVTLTTCSYLLGKYQFSENNKLSPKFQDKQCESTKKTTHEEEWIDIPIKKTNQLKTSKIINTRKNIESLVSQKPTISSVDTNIEKYSQLIDKTDAEEIDFYLNQFFSHDELQNLDDKNVFAKRLLQEYSGARNNTAVFSHGEISFSLKPEYPDVALNNFNVIKNQDIYAHLQSNGSIEDSGEIFIRWLRQSDNKILLFKRKRINLNSQRNWISLVPLTGWEEGAYTVTAYIFESDLKVIAQSSYTIDYAE